MYSNRTTEDYTEIVNRFPDIDEGLVVWQHDFYIVSGGSAQSWQVKIGNGDVGSMNLAAYYTVNSSDELLHHNGAGGTSAVSGAPTINRDQWNTLRVELNVNTQKMTTYLNEVEVDTDYDFEDECDYLDMVHYRCQISGFTSANNYWVDTHTIGHRGFLDEYTIVAMDSIAQDKLDLDDSDYPGLTSSLNYPGDIVEGSDSNNRYCYMEHQSEVYNKPITGAGDNWENYWKLSTENGSAWQENKNYSRATYNDLLSDMLLLMNGDALQHWVICNVVNHEIRFYGHSEVHTPSGLTASKIVEFEEDKTGEIILKQMSDRAVQNLRGKGTVSGASGYDYEYQVRKYEHKLRYAEILDLMEFRYYSVSNIRGIITGLSIQKSIHDYILTEVEGIGVL